MSDKVLPFTLDDLRELKGEDTYLILTDPIECRKRLGKDHDKPNRGAIYEIGKERQYSFEILELGNITRAVFEDGSPMGHDTGQLMQAYLYRLEGVRCPSGRRPVLTGPATMCDIKGHPRGDPLDQKVRVYMSEVPDGKTQRVFTFLGSS